MHTYMSWFTCLFCMMVKGLQAASRSSTGRSSLAPNMYVLFISFQKHLRCHDPLQEELEWRGLRWRQIFMFCIFHFKNIYVVNLTSCSGDGVSGDALFWRRKSWCYVFISYLVVLSFFCFWCSVSFTATPYWTDNLVFRWSLVVFTKSWSNNYRHRHGLL